MHVKEIMTSNPRTVTKDTSLMEVVSLMCLYRYAGLPVVEENKLVGFIAEKDVLHQMFPSIEDAMQSMASINFDEKTKEYKSIMGMKVSELMTKKVKSVTPDMPVLKAAIIMANNHFRRIPVAEGDELVGIISMGDIHKAIFHESLTIG